MQPPRPVDLFARLGLAATFDVDLGDLERRYFDLQRQLHPDRFAGRSPKERDFSLQHAANLNEAFQTLRSPVRRAECVLRLRGHPLPSGEHTVADAAILTHAMEMREALAEAGTRGEVEAVAAEGRAEADTVTAELAAAFAANDLVSAQRLALRLRYLEKFADEAREKRVRASA